MFEFLLNRKITHTNLGDLKVKAIEGDCFLGVDLNGGIYRLNILGTYRRGLIQLDSEAKAKIDNILFELDGRQKLAENERRKRECDDLCNAIDDAIKKQFDKKSQTEYYTPSLVPYFEGLIHYTTYNNLRKMLEMGKMCSRNRLIYLGVPFDDSAWKEVLDNTPEYVLDHTRFLYYHKTPISYIFNVQHRSEEYCVIVFGRELMYEQDMIYFGKAPTTSDSENLKEMYPNKAAMFYDWEQIVERGWYDTEVEGSWIKKKYRDAEVLGPSEVSTGYIKEIHFKFKETYQKACADYAGQPIAELFRYDNEKSRFDY